MTAELQQQVDAQRREIAELHRAVGVDHRLIKELLAKKLSALLTFPGRSARERPVHHHRPKPLPQPHR